MWGAHEEGISGAERGEETERPASTLLTEARRPDAEKQEEHRRRTEEINRTKPARQWESCPDCWLGWVIPRPGFQGTGESWGEV